MTFTHPDPVQSVRTVRSAHPAHPAHPVHPSGRGQWPPAGGSGRGRWRAGLAVAIVLLLPLPSLQADDGRRLAASCTACHGPDGQTVGDALPPLAGQPREALLASLRAFKAGERSATVMTQIVRGYSDEQLERIAAFFAAREPVAASGTGSGS